MRGGHYGSREWLNYQLARYHHFWHDLAPTLEAERHRNACPLGEWYERVYGRSILQDEALGLEVMGKATEFLGGQPASFVAEGEFPENPLVVGRDTLLAATALALRP